MKDVDRFIVDLERPPRGVVVTADDLDADAENFMAFAAAMGVKPPSAGSNTPAGVPYPASTPEAVEG